MSKTETGAAGVKAAYVCPRIACYEAESESSLCVGTSPYDSGHNKASFDADLEEEDES